MGAVDATRAARAAIPPLAASVAALAVLLLKPGSATTASEAPISPARSAPATAQDCAPCHAREVAQWRASPMALAARSPLVGALESFVEEQVGRDAACPNGAGALRVRGRDACFDERSGVAETGAGGEHWCVNCHAPGENLRPAMPAWSGHGSPASRLPMRDLLPAASLEGISCAACHSAIGPVARHAARPRAYEGNAFWTSTVTGATFLARPEDATGRPGIANSGYLLEPRLLSSPGPADGSRAHAPPPVEAARYVASSEFCGACHDVRLFGTDVRGAGRGEHFKRLRNAYSEWRAWAQGERRAGRPAPSCQDCHMSLYPGTCAAGGSGDQDCPAGTHFEARAPGTYARAAIATSSPAQARVSSHWFTGVELPLADELPTELVENATLDPDGVPVGMRARRDMLLRHTFRLGLGQLRRRGGTLEVPVEIENVGAGHRVPGGFSQEREVWVELTVTDGRGSVVYEVGRVDRPDDDLADKRFVRITTSDAVVDARSRPQGLFGADVADGPDAPAWSPDPRLGGARFVGRGLVNLQNGFERCVRCAGRVDSRGACQALVGQEIFRASRFADGDYDIDTGECRSNLDGEAALFETYLPVGALDADRGIAKAPDAIVDSRSAPPRVPLEYRYLVGVGGRAPPFEVRARLLFRPFPPYLVRAFAAYERAQDRAGLRPSGPQVSERMLLRDEPVELARAEATAP
jgi:hypothetical protein